MRGIRSSLVPLALVLATAGCASSSPSAGPTVVTGVVTSTTGTTAPRQHGPKATPGHEAYCDTYYHEMVVLSDELGVLNVDPVHPKDPAPFVVLVKASYQKLAEQAPADAKGDLEVVANYLQTTQSTDQMADLTAQPEVKAANDRHLQWVVANCGFDPSNLAGS